MPRFTAMGAVILLLALFSPCGAMEAVPGRQALQQGNSANASEQREVVNVVIDRIEDGVLYSKDQQTFRITGAAKIIDNSHSATKVRTAELVFENGSLVAVSIK